MQKWFAWPRLLLLSPLPLLTAAAFAGILLSVRGQQRGASNREWLPFVLSVWIFAFAFAGLAYSLYPYLVVDRMTIWQAAAARESLMFVFVGTCVVLPMIIGYTVFSYRVFWGKARALTYGE
jgi:cytochrome d ubiquinol oxidase subunit II